MNIVRYFVFQFNFIDKESLFTSYFISQTILFLKKQKLLIWIVNFKFRTLLIKFYSNPNKLDTLSSDFHCRFLKSPWNSNKCKTKLKLNKYCFEIVIDFCDRFIPLTLYFSVNLQNQSFVKLKFNSIRYLVKYNFFFIFGQKTLILFNRIFRYNAHLNYSQRNQRTENFTRTENTVHWSSSKIQTVD